MEGFLFCKGKYIPSAEGNIPGVFRDLVKTFLVVCYIVKIKKNYIVGCIFEIPVCVKGCFPVRSWL